MVIGYEVKSDIRSILTSLINYLFQDQFLGAVHGEDKVGEGVLRRGEGESDGVPVVEGDAHHEVAANLQDCQMSDFAA